MVLMLLRLMTKLKRELERAKIVNKYLSCCLLMGYDFVTAEEMWSSSRKHLMNVRVHRESE